MTQICPHCNASVGDQSAQCPSCGQELDVFLTIPPPRFNPAQAPSRPSKPAGPAPPSPPPAGERRPESFDEPAPREAPRASAPATPPVARKRPRPQAPPPAPAASTPPRPTPSPPQPPAPAPAYYAPQPPITPTPQPPVPPTPPPGKLRRWLIESLGGRPTAPPYEGPPPGYGYAPPQGPPPGYGTQPPPYAAPMPPVPPSHAPPPMPTPTGPDLPAQGGPSALDDEEMRTMAFGADLAKFKMATGLLTLQIFDRSGQWHDWTTIGANGVKVGRTEKNARFPELNSMAVKHMRIGQDGSRLVVEDLGSLNGVYLKLTRFVTLEPGQRFRVGAQVIEFQRAEPLPPAEPLVGDDGEAFWSRDLDAIAHLQLIRTDGKPGLRFPITRPDVTILGRESRPGRPVDIALPNDEWASGQHAQIRRDGENFLLEDLGSRNGTFVQLRGLCEILPGDVLLVGRVLLRAVDAARTPR